MHGINYVGRTFINERLPGRARVVSVPVVLFYPAFDVGIVRIGLS